MYSGRTGESLDTIYWVEGEYVDEAIREITLFMRDWRNNKIMHIDPRTVDIMTASHRLLNVDEPYLLLSGYRSPETNAMLRAPVERCGQELAAHEGPGGRPAAALALGRADGAGRTRLQRRRRRTVHQVELRPHGLRPGPPLGQLTAGGLRPARPFTRDDGTGRHGRPQVSAPPLAAII